jgi:hypothetical protein
VVEHSIGNGEVDSSILSGSTIFFEGFIPFFPINAFSSWTAISACSAASVAPWLEKVETARVLRN